MNFLKTKCSLKKFLVSWVTELLPISYLKSYTFCLYFNLFLHVWIRIRNLNTDQDPQSSWIRIHNTAHNTPPFINKQHFYRLEFLRTNIFYLQQILRIREIINWFRFTSWHYWYRYRKTVVEKSLKQNYDIRSCVHLTP